MKRRISCNLTGLMLFSLLTIGFAAQTVPERAEDVHPVAAGEPAPAFSVRSPDGQRREIAAGARAAPQLVIFYRGGWCPYCNVHLKELRDAVPALKARGFDVLFLSADRPEILHRSLDEPMPDYDLYSDASTEAAQRFGIAFKLDAAAVRRALEHGIDLEAASGYSHHQLPVPAVFVIDRAGVVRFSYANPDYRVRLSAADVLAAADGLD